MTWSARKYRGGDRTVQLDLVGDLRGSVVQPLRSTVVQTIVGDLPDQLLVRLDDVHEIDEAGVTALMSGYIAAIDYGTSYRVRGARGSVRRVLHATRTLDVLADSDDLAALLLSVLPPLSAGRSRAGAGTVNSVGCSIADINLSPSTDIKFSCR
jgi:anti-anti-sigma regulatory factor